MDPDAADPEGGLTPLMLSAHSGHKDVVKLLLEAGARPHARALLMAERSGYAQVAQLLEAALRRIDARSIDR